MVENNGRNVIVGLIGRVLVIAALGGILSGCVVYDRPGYYEPYHAEVWHGEGEHDGWHHD